MKKALLNIGTWLGLIHNPAEPMSKLLCDRDSIYFKPEIRKVYPDRLLDFNDNFKHIHKEIKKEYFNQVLENVTIAQQGLNQV